MGIGRRIMGVIMIVLLGSNVYASLQNSSASTFIKVDGNGARIRESIENYDCDRKHRLSITDAYLYNMLWQYSEDDQTWTDYATTSEIEVTSQPGVIGYYRCLLTKKSGGEQLLARQSVSVECGVPETCGTIDNRLVVWKDDFSSVPRGKRRNCSDVINREFNGDINSIVGDSMYAVISHMDDAKGDDMEVFTGGRDHTGNKDGGFLFFNNYKCPNCRKFMPIYDIYKKQIDFDLCPNTSYYFMAYAMNVSKIENSVNLEFYIIAEDGTTLGSNSTNLIPLSPLGKSDWYPFGVRFNSGNHRRVSIKITDIGTAAQGNKVCIDDFTLYTCDTEVPETKLTAGSSSDVDGVCGDVTTLSLSNMSEWETSCPNVYILWQKSTDGGNTWISVPELSGIKKYTAQVSFEKSIDGIRYRAIIAKDERAANYIDANGHAEESCPYFKITNMLTLSCHCEAPVSLTPSEVSVCKGADADSIALNFAVTDGSNVDEYHWMYRTSPELAWTPIRKANGPVLKVLPNVTTYYTAYAVNGDCLSDTASCVVRVKDVENTHFPLMGKDTVCTGGSSELSLNVSPTTKVSWMVKKATESDFSLLTSEDGPSMEVTPGRGDSYYAITEMDPQTCASGISDTITFFVTDSLHLKIMASADTTCENGTVTLFADYDGATDIVWEKQSEEYNNFETISTDMSRSIDVIPYNKTLYRFRTADDGKCPVFYSDTAMVVVVDSIRIMVEPPYVEISKDELFELKAEITGDMKSFEWKKKVDLTETTQGYDYEINDVADVDCDFIIEARGNLCPDVSVTVPVTVIQPQELMLSLSTDTICSGGEATLTTDLSNVQNIIWLAREDDAADFTEITEFSLDPKSTNKVTPTTTTQYKIQERGTDNYSDIVTLYVEQPAGMELNGPKITSPGCEVALYYKVTAQYATAEITLQESNVDTVMERSIPSDGNTTYGQLLFTPVQESEYTLIVNTKYCPEKRLSHTVKMLEVSQELTLFLSADTICSGGEATLTTGFNNVSDIVWLAKADTVDDFTEITEFSLDPKSTNKVSPTTTTQYRIREKGTDNYSDIVTLYVAQPVEMKSVDDVVTACPGEIVYFKSFFNSKIPVNEVFMMETTDTSEVKSPLTFSSTSYYCSGDYLLSVLADQEKEVAFVVTSKYCPEKSVSFPLKLYDVPNNFTFTASADTICEGDSVVFTTDFPFSEDNLWLEFWPSTDAEYLFEKSPEMVRFESNAITRYPNLGDSRYGFIAYSENECRTEPIFKDIHVSKPLEDVVTDTTVCEGVPAVLRIHVAESGSQFTWSNTADFSNVVGSDDSLRITPTEDMTYYVKVKNEACEKFLEQNVFLFSLPEIYLKGDDFICRDTSVDLMGGVSSMENISQVILRESVGGIVVGDSSLWDNSMGGVKDAWNFQVLRSPEQNTEYSLVVVPKQCAAAQVSHFVKVADKEPDYTFTASADSVCPGNPVTLTALFPNEPESMALYSYYPGNYGEAKEIVEKCTNPVDVYPDGELEYRLVPTYSNGCLGEAHTLSVHMLEPVTGEPWDTTVCEGQSAVLRVRASGTGENYIWSSNADFTDTIGTGDKLNIIPSEEKTYYVKLVDGKCASVMEERVHVVSAPEIGLTGEDKVCPGAELTLQYSVSSLTDLSRIFMRKSMSGSVVDEFELWNGSVMGEDWYAGDYTDGPSREMEYTLVVVPNHCPAIDTSIVVGIAEVPTGFTFTASADSICLGDSVLLSTDFPFSEGNLKLDVWHPEDVDYPAESGVMEAGSEYNYPYDDFRYDLIARTEEGCYADTLSLTIRVSQPMEFTLADTTVCEGETVQLRVHATEPETRYVWSASVDFSDTLGFGDRISVSPTADAEYYVKAVNGKCEKTSQLAVHIAPNPSIELETEGRSAICNGVGGSGDYLYDLGDGFSSVNKLDFVVPSMSYTFTVKDGWGCLADTTFSMVYDELTIPEYFTPQSDGVHDRWEIVNLDKYQQVKVSIYDRFGKKLFETNDPEFSWDGTYNGNPLPSEDYWYAIYVKDIDRFFKGHFTLIRAK